MSKDINSVVLVGRLTRDADLKTVGNTSLLEFSIASNYRTKKGDEWTDQVNFFECDIWGKGAEALAKHMVKGKKIAVKGELRQERWEQEGQKRNRVKILCEEIELLSQVEAAQEGQQASSGQDASLGPKDDIPF
jgi:single-strand DNA-binding protein